MNIWLIADLHLSHKGIVQWLREDGSKERPWDTIEEMNEALIENYNSVVRPKDKVYILGDVVINRSALPLIARLQGRKILVKGNHDTMRLDEYAQYFEDIRGNAVIDNHILTHIPIHPCSVGRWDANIHGHLHHNKVMMTKPGYQWFQVKDIPDPRYFCVSAEQANYTPIAFEVAKKRIKENKEWNL